MGKQIGPEEKRVAVEDVLLGGRLSGSHLQLKDRFLRSDFTSR